MEERSAGRDSRSRIVVVTTSTSYPRATRRRTSSPAATTGPPKARDGDQAGAANRMRTWRSLAHDVRPPQAAPARPQPVLLAWRRGDRSASDRALRGPRGGCRDQSPHGRAAWARGRAAPRRPERSRDRSRPLDVVRALEARCARRELRDIPDECAPPRAARFASRRRPVHDRPSNRRRHRPARRPSLPRAAGGDQPGRLSRDRRAAEATGESGRDAAPARPRLALHAQDLDSLVRAATFLRDLDDLSIFIIGTGARHAELVALAELLDVDQVSFLYYQSRGVLPQSLSAADLHVVGLAPGLAGYVVPSRLYGILAVGRPVIVAADRDSETAQVVER